MPKKRPEAPNRVRELRLEKGWTQQQLAQLSSCSHSQIQRVEVGKKNPSQDLMRRIGKAFRLDPGQIFFNSRLPPDDEGQGVLSLAAQMDDNTRAAWLEMGETLLKRLGGLQKPRPQRRA